MTNDTFSTRLEEQVTIRAQSLVHSVNYAAETLNRGLR